MFTRIGWAGIGRKVGRVHRITWRGLKVFARSVGLC